MRFLLLLLLLVGAMAAAGLWQERWTRAARAHRDRLLGRAAVADPGPRRARLVLGRPSGNPPHDVPWGPPRPLPTPPADDRVEAGSAPAARSGSGEYAPAPWEPVFEVEVRPGKVLSVLCQEFYGTARPSVVQRVAEWNGLKSPDQLRVGQRIELPARAWILGEAP